MTPSVPEEERERLLTHFFAMDPPQRNNYEINIKIYDYYKREC